MALLYSSYRQCKCIVCLTVRKSTLQEENARRYIRLGETSKTGSKKIIRIYSEHGCNFQVTKKSIKRETTISYLTMFYHWVELQEKQSTWEKKNWVGSDFSSTEPLLLCHSLWASGTCHWNKSHNNEPKILCLNILF